MSTAHHIPKISFIVPLLLIFPIFHAVAESQNSARQELENRSIIYSSREFMVRVLEGDIETVKLFLAAGMDANTQKENGDTVLIVAARKGLTKMARYLLANGADINARGEHRNTALMKAARQGHTDTVKALMDAGAKFNERNRYGRTAFLLASSSGMYDVMELLIQAGANVSIRDDRGSTALILAAWQPDPQAVKFLIEHGAEVDASNQEGETALTVAAENGYKQTVKVLIDSKANVNIHIHGRQGLTPLMNVHASVAELLIAAGAKVNERDDSGRSPLMHAASLGFSDAVRVLISSGAEPNARSKRGYTPLMQTIKWLFCSPGGNNTFDVSKQLLNAGARIDDVDPEGISALMLAVECGNEQLAELLLDRGADVHVANKRGWTAFFYAVWNGLSTLLAQFVEHGVNINRPDPYGWTPLMYAVEKGDADIVKRLIAYGADPAAETPGGWTPLIRAALNMHTEIVNNLLPAGSEGSKSSFTKNSVSSCSVRGGVANIVDILKRQPGGVNARNLNGETALIRAAIRGCDDIASRLLVEGADVNAVNKGGWSALSFVSQSGHEHIVRKLIKRKADVNAQNKVGSTPLIFAVANDHATIVKELLRAGADPDAGSDLTALMRAAKYGYADIARILLEYGARVNRADDQGHTALRRASWITNAETIKVLIDNGAKPVKGSLLVDYFTARRKNDEGAIKKLFRSADPISVYGYINDIVTDAFDKALAKRDSSFDFQIAGKFARSYEQSFGISGIHALVHLYRTYSIKDIKMRNRANELLNSARRLLEKDHAESAQADAEGALKLSRSIRDALTEARALAFIGGIHTMMGQYAVALRAHERALIKFREVANMEGQALSYAGIGNIYANLGLYEKAIKQLSYASDIDKRSTSMLIEDATLMNMGWAYMGLGEYEQALVVFKQYLYIYGKAFNPAGKVNNAGGSFYAIATVYYQQEKYREALHAYQEARGIFQEANDKRGEASALHGIGLTYDTIGDYQRAIWALRESMRVSKALIQPETLWGVQSALGKALWKTGQLEEAVDHYRKAIGVIEKIYTSTKGLKEEERTSMIGGKTFVYREFIELLLELRRKHPGKGYGPEAFMVSEKAKSRVFQEMMARAGAKVVFSGDGVFQGMVERERRLVGEQSVLRKRLTGELSKPEGKRNKDVVASLKKQLRTVEEAVQQHQKATEEKYPRYANLKRPKPLRVEDMQRVLKEGEALVAYSVGQERSVAFVLGRGRFMAVELEVGEKEIGKVVKKFRRGLEGVSTLKNLEKFRPRVAHELYQKLFAPVVAELKGVRTLYISGDDVLYTVPFEALVERYDQKAFREARKAGRKGTGPYLGEYTTLRYLVDDYTIVYLPSAGVLRSLRKYEKVGYGRWEKELIAFADPVFSPGKTSAGEIRKKSQGIQQRGISLETKLALQVLTRSTGGGKLVRLKESAEEAEAVAREVGGKEEDIYLRYKATEKNVRKVKLVTSRYILFSTHGLLGGDFTGVAEPALALTLVGNPSGMDGFLTMSEVLGLNLNAELVILSACNTSGSGEKAGKGEGFAGLTRSFMYAGTKSLLVTLWSVESEAARNLMVDTFRKVGVDRKPEALRKAKRSMKSSARKMGKRVLSLSHPFFWAPFVLVGEGG